MILSGNLEAPFLTFSGLKCTHCFPNPKPYFKWSLFRIVQIYTRRFTYIQRKLARELFNFNLLILKHDFFGQSPILGFEQLDSKDLHFRNRRVCDCIVVFTFYTRTFALKSNYLHHHQLYTESQCKNLLFIYMELSHKNIPSNGTHQYLLTILLHTSFIEETETKLQVQCWLLIQFYRYNKKEIYKHFPIVSRNQPKIWCSSVCVLIINVCAWS